MGEIDSQEDALETFQVTSLKRELAERDEALAAAWQELEAIRNRRVVRLANRIRRPFRRTPATDAAVDEAGDVTMPADAADRPLFYWPELTHFHSPVPDTRLLSTAEMRARLWPEEAPEQPGVDWNGDRQLELMKELAAQEPMRFPRTSEDPTEFFSENPAFAPHDAWALQAMLRHLRPERMIEVGSGWTSLLAARVNREHLDGSMELTCIDPFPQDFMKGGVEGVAELLEQPIERMPIDYFDRLRSGDALFIDSTHTVKTGSDVVYLFGEVVPRLQPGVVVHVHDIFLPGEYPPQWVLSGWAWNEQYLLQSFLAFNGEFEVALSLGWLAHRHPEVVEAAVPEFERFYPGRGGSLWIRRKSR